MFDIRQTPEFSQWLKKLRDRKASAIITTRLLRAAQGNLGDHKSLGDDLFEFRIMHGAGYRVYFCREGSKIVILLVGGDKSSQKRDIAKAREIMKGLEE